MRKGSKENRKTVLAIYARKSKFTGKGESINNQIAACEHYVKEHFTDGEYEIRAYVDEGISGKDLERPQMQQMLKDIKEDMVDVLICYRLDRVSRSVRDFSNLIDDLTGRGKEFISVNEAFDTRTPMGRAMMMIASVFSQLERETIAERIVDNMFALAKTGRWLGGKTPLGFQSEKVVEEDGMAKKRSRYRLVPIAEEIELVRLIFTKYRELGSLTKLETYLMNSGFRTKNGKYYGRYVLRAMLTNPVYVKADRSVLLFLRERHYGIYADETLFDGEHGLIAYNKNNCRGKTQRFNDVEEWIVSVGEHEGVISSDLWISVQKLVKSGSNLKYRQPKKSGAVLSGMVRCAACGSLMRPKSSRVAKSDGLLRYSYVCETKEKSRGKLCQMPNIPGKELDEMISDAVLQLKEQILTEYEYLEESIEEMEKEVYFDSKGLLLKKQMEENERQLQSLLDALGRSANERTTDSILKRMDEINTEKERLKRQLEKEESDKIMELGISPVELLAENLISMDREMFYKISVGRRKEILREVVKKIVWDGENAEVHFWSEDHETVQAV
ncbi:MAG: recombinase family protein [Lachnospiraceae bacterium]|nr:recombinase family protein [Lachnospiraceae bacterium]